MFSWNWFLLASRWVKTVSRVREGSGESVKHSKSLPCKKFYSENEVFEKFKSNCNLFIKTQRLIQKCSARLANIACIWHALCIWHAYIRFLSYVTGLTSTGFNNPPLCCCVKAQRKITEDWEIIISNSIFGILICRIFLTQLKNWTLIYDMHT